MTLEELDVSSNVIYSLSDDIGNLVNLRKLLVNSNKLATLPKAIKCVGCLARRSPAAAEVLTRCSTLGGWAPPPRELKKLQWLEVRNNALVTLPPEVGELTELQKLDVSHNKLPDLPTELHQLTKLVVRPRLARTCGPWGLCGCV